VIRSFEPIPLHSIPDHPIVLPRPDVKHQLFLLGWRGVACVVTIKKLLQPLRVLLVH
jgi:hypothetical protein